MASKVVALVAMAHVQSVPASVAFYAHLGFEVRNTVRPPGAEAPVWAWLGSADAQLMVTRADGPVDAAQQAVLFYTYTPDLEGVRDRLVAAGVDAGPIAFPFYSPRGEFRITDPDGYVIIVAHT